jgi:DNA-binding transcriptional MerR regulator
MFRIGDFSRMAQVTIRTLRLYDEMALLKPAHIDRFTDYRYYTIEQLPRLNRILAMKDMGFSLEEITRLLDGNLPTAQLWEMLSQKQTEIAQEVNEAQTRLARVQNRLRQIEQEGQPPRFDVVLKKAESLSIAATREVVPMMENMSEVRCRLAKSLYTSLAEHHIKPLEPEIFLYHSNDYSDTDIDMEVGTVVEKNAKLPTGLPVTLHTLPATDTLAAIAYDGDIRNVIEPVFELLRWAGQHGYASNGPIRELHLWGREADDPDNDLRQVTLEVQLPLVPLDSPLA